MKMSFSKLFRLMQVTLLVATCISSVAKAELIVDGPGHQVTSGRTSISLNGDWKFITDPKNTGESLGYPNKTFNDKLWNDINVPGSWSLYDTYADYIGKGWYRSTVSKPIHNQGERVWLRFEAAYYDTDVWFNGHLLGNHKGGYTPFEFDVTDLLQQNNTVAVRSDNTYSIGAWYFWGGITRDVNLIIDPEVRIVRQKFTAEPDLENGKAKITTNVTVGNSSNSERSVQVTGEFTDLQGSSSTAVSLSTVKNGSSLLTIPAGEERTISLSTTLNSNQYKLWHFDEPNLYRSNVSIASQNHTVSDRVGIRKIELDGTNFLLNGEKVRLNGYNRVSDDRANGSVEPLYVIRRDMDRMKAAGANLSRIMHYGQHPALLDYADEKGMLLTAEVPVWGKDADLSTNSDAQVYTDIDELLQRDWNHASIFAWSVANEIKSGSQKGNTFVSTMIDYIKNNHDSTRFLTFSTNKAVKPTEASQFSDFVSKNSYQKFESRSIEINSSFPNKAAFISEFSSDGFIYPTSRERLNHTTGADTAYATYGPHPWIFGVSVWAYNDYRSTFKGTSTNGYRGWGMQNAWGGLKDSYYEMQTVYAPVNNLSVITTTNGTNVSFTAKTMLELPAFTLRDYKIVIQGINHIGQVVGGSVLNLEDIPPQGERFEKHVRWNKSGLNIVEERVSLVTPTGYEVDVARTAITIPSNLAVQQVIRGNESIRVIFDHVAGATSYELSVDGTKISTTTNLEKFLEVSGLNTNQTYTLQLKAINSRGNSQTKINVTTLSTASEMAPIMQAATPVSGGVMVGYIADENHVSRDIEVVNASNNNVVKSQNTYVDGASRVTGLAANVDHKVRVRGISSSGSKSVWSEWLTFRTIDQSSQPTTPTFKGVVAGSNTIAVAIIPHPQAEYYMVRAASENNVIKARVNLAAVDNLLVDGLTNNTEYDVSIRVYTSTGVSVYSPIIKVTTSTPDVELSNRIETIADQAKSDT